MKLWIAKDEGSNYCTLFIDEPHKEFNNFTKKYSWRTDDMLGTYMCLPSSEFKNVTFENSPQEVELKLSNFTSKQLTRDYFAKHNWEIIIPEPDENGFVLWEARWIRSMEEGSPYYSNLTVTNMMYEDRFCISGKTGEGNIEYLMAYTEEDLENILKVLAIYDYYKKES